MLPSLDPGSLAALFAAMALLAALPSTSVLIVTAHANAHGFRNGAAVAAGVVAGDLVYVLVAIFGLQLLVSAMSGMTETMRYVGALYLLWFAWRLWRTAPPAARRDDEDVRSAGSTLHASFVSGLLITLGDQKAILFYLGFLPAFIDLASLRSGDIALVALVTVVAVGGVKLIYAALADGARALLAPETGRALHRLAAVVVAGVAVYLVGDTFLSNFRLRLF